MQSKCSLLVFGFPQLPNWMQNYSLRKPRHIQCCPVLYWKMISYSCHTLSALKPKPCLHPKLISFLKSPLQNKARRQATQSLQSLEDRSTFYLIHFICLNQKKKVIYFCKLFSENIVDLLIMWVETIFIYFSVIAFCRKEVEVKQSHIFYAY